MYLRLLRLRPIRSAGSGRFIWTLAPLTVASGSLLYLKSQLIHADQPDQVSPKRAQTPISTLLRSYAVYSICSIPLLVDWSPSLLSTLFSVPGLRQLTETVVRYTFFQQFVGGESARDTWALLRDLREQNKGVLLAYSVEVDQNQLPSAQQPFVTSIAHKHNVEEMIQCVDVAAEFEDETAMRAPQEAQRQGRGRTTWVAVKLTALISSADSLTRLSHYLTEHRPPTPDIPFPGIPYVTDLDALEPLRPTSNLTADDLVALMDLRDDLVCICTRAKEKGVRVIIDAEYSWYQPAIDAYALYLMHRFNKINSSPPRRTFLKYLSGLLRPATSSSYSRTPPTVYTTFQAYLRRTPAHLNAAFLDAQEKGYALGVKLVRGAYHPLEVEQHRRQTKIPYNTDPLPPVWSVKSETDACYDYCASLLIYRMGQAIKGTGAEVAILFGTHNWTSAKNIVQGLKAQGLATPVGSSVEQLDGESLEISIGEEVAERFALGQLFGMSDALTNYLVKHINSPMPVVIKYVPYGGLTEVMPYLARRAVENKSVMSGSGGAAEERRLARQELWRRIVS